MSVFRDFAELMWDYMELRYKEEREYEIAQQKKLEEKRKKKLEKELLEREKEDKLRAWANEEMQKNPDEWKVLPYGWSPFGMYL